MKTGSKFIFCLFGLSLFNPITYAAQPKDRPPLNHFYPNLNWNYKDYGPFYEEGRCIVYRRLCERHQICNSWSETHHNAYWNQACFMCSKPRKHELDKYKATCKFWYMRQLQSRGFHCRPTFFGQYFFGPERGFCNDWTWSTRCHVVCIERSYNQSG